MGMFGVQVAEGEDSRVVVPEGWVLQLCQACLVGGKKSEPTTLRVRADLEDDKAEDFILCELSAGAGGRQCALTHKLSVVDSPIFNITGPGSIHLTGYFERDPWAEDEESEYGDEEEEEEQQVYDEESEEERVAEVSNTGKKVKRRQREEEEEAEEEEEEEEEEEDAHGPGSLSASPPKKKKRKQQLSEKEKQDQEELVKMEKKEKKRLKKKEAAEKKKALSDAFARDAEADTLARVKQEGGGGIAVGVPLKKPIERRAPGGLKITDVVLGGGKTATAGKKAELLYEGCFPDGTVFDKNWNRRKPLSFRVGIGQVVKGMDRGVEGMRVGGIRELFIPAALGYGKRGAGPIPANQDLVFRIELVAVSGRK